MSTKTLPEVFMRRAQGIAHLLRDRGIWRWGGVGSGEPMNVGQFDNDDGTVTLAFTRKSDGHARLEFRNIKASGVSEIHFGEETVLKSESLGSRSKDIDNRGGKSDIEEHFRDLFADTEGHEKSTEKSAGTSVAVEVSAKEGIEGVAEFDQKVTAEAHAEISESESESSEITKENEDEETFTIAAGAHVRITESRSRGDVTQEITAVGDFTFGMAIGKHSGGKFVGGHNAYWDSWSQFLSVVNGHAPDNWSLAGSFKQRGPWHADRWALDALNSVVKYDAKFEGRIISDFKVETLGI